MSATGSNSCHWARVAPRLALISTIIILIQLSFFADGVFAFTCTSQTLQGPREIIVDADLENILLTECNLIDTTIILQPSGGGGGDQQFLSSQVDHADGALLSNITSWKSNFTNSRIIVLNRYIGSFDIVRGRLQNSEFALRNSSISHNSWGRWKDSFRFRVQPDSSHSHFIEFDNCTMKVSHHMRCTCIHRKQQTWMP